MVKKPNSRRNLDEAIRRVYGIDGFVPVRDAMANAIVAQLLPGGVVKGGSALKLRFGNECTRYTTDLDTARNQDLSEFIDAFEQILAEGWEGFTGHVVPRDPASPEGIPTQYVMQPFDIKLSFNQKSWMTVPLEVGHNEIGDADVIEYVIAADIADLFTSLGFSIPKAAPLMPLHYQIAQKLHGASEPESKRAHDLIDLQLIMELGEIDLRKTKDTCTRLFSYRGQQVWPPLVVKNQDWDNLYLSQSEGLQVLQSVDEAIDWANELIQSIDKAY